MITNSNQIALRHLRYFVVLARELHFHRAAALLYISQPALSKQLKQLEDFLGVVLLERSQQSVQLTAAGAFLQEEAQQLLQAVDRMASRIQAIHKGESGELRIGFVGSAMHTVIPPLLVALQARFPAISSSLTELGNQQQMDMLLHDRLEIGFIRLMHLPPGLTAKAIYEETFSLVLPANHPLEAANFPGMSALREAPFVFFSPAYSPEYYEKVISICRDAGFYPKISHNSVHANTIFRLVENGLGVALVPSSLTQGFDLRIKFIPLHHIPQRTQLYLVWKEDTKHPIVASVLDLIELFDGLSNNSLMDEQPLCG